MFLDSDTPTKDETSLVEEAALLLTPSRHNDDVKPTSLFSTTDSSISTSVGEPTTSNVDDLNTTPESLKTRIENMEVSTTPEIFKTPETRKTSKQGTGINNPTDMPTTSKTVESFEAKTSKSEMVSKVCETAELLNGFSHDEQQQTARAATEEVLSVKSTKLLETEINEESPMLISGSENNNAVSQYIDAQVQTQVESSTIVEGRSLESCSFQEQPKPAQQMTELLEKLSTTFDHDSVDTLTNEELFNLMGQLDQLSKKAMTTLRTRMSANK